jgi:predicted transcriptional regulator of viral defense system
MKATEAYRRLIDINSSVIKTRDAMIALGISLSGASYVLSRLEKDGFVIQLKSGTWLLDTKKDAWVIAKYITMPDPCYISLLSALSYHKMIQQIPQAIELVSLGRAQKAETPIGNFKVYQVTPILFGDYIRDKDIVVASPEKAIFDYMYLKSVQGGFKAGLFEIEPPANFNEQIVEKWIGLIPSLRLKTMTQKAWENVKKEMDTIPETLSL